MHVCTYGTKCSTFDFLAWFILQIVIAGKGIEFIGVIWELTANNEKVLESLYAIFSLMCNMYFL